MTDAERKERKRIVGLFVKWGALFLLAIATIMALQSVFTKPNEKRRIQLGGQPSTEPVEAPKAPEDILTKDKPFPAEKFDMVKDRKPGDKPYTGKPVLYTGYRNMMNGHMNLQLTYGGLIQSFSWPLATDHETWVEGDWSDIPEHDETSDAGNSGKIKIKEQKGGVFLIKKYDRDKHDSKEWVLDYTGTITPVLSASRQGPPIILILIGVGGILLVILLLVFWLVFFK